MSILLHRSGIMSGFSGMDPLVSSFAAASGATDLDALNDLIKYVRDQSLLPNFRIYPMKSAQNAGSDLTVYGVGNLTSNNMALVGSPTWGSGGLLYVPASSQYGIISNIIDSETVTVFVRTALTVSEPASIGTVVSKYTTTGNARAWALYQDAGGDFTMVRSSDGGSTNLETYNSTGEAKTTASQCLVSQWQNSNSRSFWQNKTSITLNLSVGTAQSSTADVNASVLFSARRPISGPDLYLGQTAQALAFLTVNTDSTIRETITDMINVL